MSGKSPKVDQYASIKRAQIAEDQYQNYLNFYTPIEDKAFEYLYSTEQQAADVNRAGEYAGKAFDAMQGANARNLNRYGISPSAEMRSNMESDRARSKTLAVIDTKNRAREAVQARVDRLSEDMVNIGKGVQRGADQTMNSWLQVEGLHNQQRANDAANKNANRNAMMGTAASIGLTIASIY